MEHQRSGVEFLRAHPRALLADEPGLGKSRVALEAATSPVLIVGPAMVLDGGVWDDEIEKWAPGDAYYRQEPYSRLMLREGRHATSTLRPDLRRHWGTVIFDEAHYLKGRKTKWTLAAKQITSDRTILLTGTPLSNWAHEAFTLLQMMFPDESKSGQRLGSYWRFCKEWFNVGPSYSRSGRLLTHHAVGDLRADRTWDEFIADNWRDRMLRRLRDACLDLPPMTEQTIRVDMTPAQAKAYRELKKDFVTWLDSGEEIAAWSQAAQLVKLAMCATGLEVLGGANGSGKLDALETLLKDRPAPTLVVAHFRASVAAVAARAQLNGLRVGLIDGGTTSVVRGEVVRQFQAGELDVLCATIDTISEGLTLNAADQVIFVERSWRPSRNEQCLRRIHRIGQDKPVSAIHLVTRGSADERVIELLKAKSDQQLKALTRSELRELV